MNGDKEQGEVENAEVKEKKKNGASTIVENKERWRKQNKCVGENENESKEWHGRKWSEWREEVKKKNAERKCGNKNTAVEMSCEKYGGEEKCSGERRWDHKGKGTERISEE